MGCDIHMVTEVRRDGAWQVAEPFFPCEACDPEHGWYKESPKSCLWCRGAKLVNGWGQRNYNVFARLADVRNYAEVDPISKLRGLPPGSPAKARDEARIDDAWLGDHSQSWLSLRDLLGFDWTAPQSEEGVVTLAEWRAMKAEGRGPGDWARDVSGRDVDVIPERTAHDYVEPAGRHTYVRATWIAPTAVAHGTFPAFVEALKKLGAPDDVRIVFGFDS